MSTHLQHLARRLVNGAGTLTRRQARRLTAWIRAGRRADLTGLAAVLGCILRALLAALGLYLLWRLIRACPNLLWFLVPVWCWRAIRAAPRTVAEQAPEDVPEEPQPDPRDAVLRLLYEALGDRPAMYLSDVLQHLQEKGHGEGWKVADLRARLEALDIPVEMRLKTGGRGASRGVVRAQLPPLPEGLGAAPSSTASTAA
ncbi:hypothetical protein [Streptomyces fulvorobeus]|uniref:Uncharacterized protein n=1 Tax=Streptomyces fulvorobeus TaxID=284028 RepID=A0A7J0C3E7_9ACTN|nr:hypothetical protein [Streptomyces fulvorobeus]NYE40708.1 hypothetical protein [Streptomyces fulvorobeus]GFM97010.1 hypothetical protein Sfulv_18210 [Streptomyces fulvorobeus]